MNNNSRKKRDFQDILYHLYAIFVVCVTFWIYVKTLAPTVSFFDSGELIAAAYTFGVAHPPGYPLYVLLGWVFSKLPIGSGAWRINLMSAFFAVLATLMVYYIAHTIITRPVSLSSDSEPRNRPDPERMLYPVLSMIAALTFAFSITNWQHAVITEVYSLNTFLSGLIVYLLFKWWKRCSGANSAKTSGVFKNSGNLETMRASEDKAPEVSENSGSRQGATRIYLQHSWLLYLVALVFGLGFGNHQTISLLFFAACFVVLITVPGIITHIRTLLWILLFLGLGISIYLLVPLRAAQDPPINWGNASTLRQFKWLVVREGYKNVPRGYALKTLWNALLEKEESSADDPPDKNPETVVPEKKKGLAKIYHLITQSLFLKQLKSFDPLEQFGYMGAALAMLGLLYGLFAHRVVSVTLLIAVVSLVLITVIIGDPPEENIFLVKEFHAPSYLLVAVWIGMGMMAIGRAALWVASKSRNLQYGVVFVIAIYFLILPGNQMLKNLRSVDRRRNYVAYDYASNVLNSLKPNAILFTWGDSGAFPLWYLQFVEKIRTDVTLIHVPHLSADWYVESLPQDLFFSDDPYHTYSGNIVPIIEGIVRENIQTRPVYFDYSSAHSLAVPYSLIPNGVTYKIAVKGDTLAEDVWNRYRFRGILDSTHIARDPDIDRTFLMYGSAHVELGHYYLQFDETEKAAEQFNIAVQFEPSLGDRIVRDLHFQDKLAGDGSQYDQEREK